MKTLWTIAATLAVANVLALAGFVGWLQASGRLDMARVQRVRAVLAPTLTEEAAVKAQDDAKVEADRKAAEQKAKDALPAETAAAQIEGRTKAAELDRQRVLQLQSEVAALQSSLKSERAALDAARARFEADRKAFYEERKKIAQIDGGAQFKKALGVYEALKASEAKAAMQELLRTGGDTPPAAGGSAAPPAAVPAAGPGMDKVLAYLNAMQSETRAKIIKEFIKDDPRLAADLLERLRTRGVETPGAASP